MPDLAGRAVRLVLGIARGVLDGTLRLINLPFSLHLFVAGHFADGSLNAPLTLLTAPLTCSRAIAFSCRNAPWRDNRLTFLERVGTNI